MFIPLIMTPSYHFSPFNTLQPHFFPPFRYSIPNPFSTPMPDHHLPHQSQHNEQLLTIIFSSFHSTNSKTLLQILLQTNSFNCDHVKSQIFNFQPLNFFQILQYFSHSCNIYFPYISQNMNPIPLLLTKIQPLLYNFQ